MRAAYYERTGPSGELRVRVQWSGVNPSDVKSRGGLRNPAMPFPRVVPHALDGQRLEVVGVEAGRDDGDRGAKQHDDARQHAGGDLQRPVHGGDCATVVPACRDRR